MALLSQAKKSECGTAQPWSKHLVGYAGGQNHYQKRVDYQFRSFEKKTGKHTYIHTHTDTEIEM